MTIKLVPRAVEESTAILEISFMDTDESPVVPYSATWTLSDLDNVVINSRSAVPLYPLASTFNIVLNSEDLKLPDPSTKATRTRRVLVEASYNSTAYGNGLMLREEFEFVIRDLKSRNPPA